MTDLRTILGADCNVGAPLVALLRAAGLPVIATATRSQPDARRLDFEDPATFAPAFAGVGRVLMRTPQISDTLRYLRPFIRAMVAAGVEHAALLAGDRERRRLRRGVPRRHAPVVRVQPGRDGDRRVPFLLTGAAP